MITSERGAAQDDIEGSSVEAEFNEAVEQKATSTNSTEAGI